MLGRHNDADGALGAEWKRHCCLRGVGEGRREREIVESSERRGIRGLDILVVGWMSFDCHELILKLDVDISKSIGEISGAAFKLHLQRRRYISTGPTITFHGEVNRMDINSDIKISVVDSNMQPTSRSRTTILHVQGPHHHSAQSISANTPSPNKCSCSVQSPAVMLS